MRERVAACNFISEALMPPSLSQPADLRASVSSWKREPKNFVRDANWRLAIACEPSFSAAYVTARNRGDLCGCVIRPQDFGDVIKNWSTDNFVGHPTFSSGDFSRTRDSERYSLQHDARPSHTHDTKHMTNDASPSPLPEDDDAFVPIGEAAQGSFLILALATMQFDETPIRAGAAYPSAPRQVAPCPLC